MRVALYRGLAVITVDGITLALSEGGAVPRFDCNLRWHNYLGAIPRFDCNFCWQNYLGAKWGWRYTAVWLQFLQLKVSRDFRPSLPLHLHRPRFMDLIFGEGCKLRTSRFTALSVRTLCIRTFPTALCPHTSSAETSLWSPHPDVT